MAADASRRGGGTQLSDVDELCLVLGGFFAFGWVVSHPATVWRMGHVWLSQHVPAPVLEATGMGQQLSKLRLSIAAAGLILLVVGAAWPVLRRRGRPVGTAQ